LTTARDFEFLVNGRSVPAPFVMTVGQTLTVRPLAQNATNSVVYWGDGQYSVVQGGWRSTVSASATSYAYTTPGVYRIEYATELADGGWDGRSMDVAVRASEALMAAPEPGAGCTGGPAQRVLFVGNSQIEVQNVPLMVSSLAAGAPAACPRIEASSIAVGGANLRDLWQTGRVEAALASGQYDAVVIAESIDLVDGHSPGYPQAFDDVSTAIVDAAKAYGVRPILYATPSVDSVRLWSEFSIMATRNADAGLRLDVPVAHGGLAWLRAYSALPGTYLHGADRSHANYVGATLSSLVLYATITNASPIGLAAMPQSDCSPSCPEIDSATAAVLQQLAWDEYLASAYGRSIAGAGAGLQKSRAASVVKPRAAVNAVKGIRR
jgi:hypothetical protein